MIDSTQLSESFLTILVHSAPRFWEKEWTIQVFSRVEIEYLVETGSVSWSIEAIGTVAFSSTQRSTKGGRKTRTPRAIKNRRLPTRLPQRVLQRIAREKQQPWDANANLIINGPRGLPMKKRQRDCEGDDPSERKRLKQSDCFTVEKKLDSLRKKWNPDGSLSLAAVAALKEEWAAKVKLAETELRLTELHTLEVLMGEQQQQQQQKLPDTEDTRVMMNTNITVEENPELQELVSTSDDTVIPCNVEFPMDPPLLCYSSAIEDEKSFTMDEFTLDSGFPMDDMLLPKKEFDDWSLSENMLLPDVLDLDGLLGVC